MEYLTLEQLDCQPSPIINAIQSEFWCNSEEPLILKESCTDLGKGAFLLYSLMYTMGVNTYI